MSNLIDLNKYKKAVADGAAKPRSQKTEKGNNSKSQKNKTTETPGKEVVKLWNFSQSIDAAIEDAIVQNDVPMEEVAAVVAHRLATLISITEKPDKLLPFCQKTMSKVFEEKGLNIEEELPGAV